MTWPDPAFGAKFPGDTMSIPRSALLSALFLAASVGQGQTVYQPAVAAYSSQNPYGVHRAASRTRDAMVDTFTDPSPPARRAFYRIEEAR